jgi:hypothetical protein
MPIASPEAIQARFEMPMKLSTTMACLARAGTHELPRHSDVGGGGDRRHVAG